MSKRYMKISPTNSGEGVFGFSKGNNQLIFHISNTGLLQTHELRLQGKLQIIDTTTGLPITDRTTDVNLDAFAGVSAFVQTLDIASTKYSTRSLEQIREYPRLANLIHSHLYDKANLDTQLFHETGAKGRGVDTPVEETYNEGDTAFWFSDANQTQAQRRPYCLAGGKDFDIRLVSGLFMSTPEIDLDALGGLTITLTCSPDSQVLHTDGTTTYQYQILNPRIVAPVIMPDAQMEATMAQSGTYELDFLSFTSLYNTLVSTQQQTVHKTALNGVVSVMNSYVPTSFINNFAENGLAQYNPGIRKVIFSRNGMRFPLEYDLTPELNPNVPQDQQPTTYPQLLWNGVEAVRNVNGVNSLEKTSYNPLICATEQQETKSGLFSTGVCYDVVSGAGIDASMDTLSFEVQASLIAPGDFDSNPATNPPSVSYSVYTYYLAKNSVMVDKGQGVMVEK